MKVVNYFLICIALVFTGALISCNSNNSPAGGNTDACSGNNLCFKMDGTQKSYTAKWVIPPGGRNRVLWEEGSGSNYKNIELDIYGNAVGSYPIDTSSSASSHSTFQYFINEGGTATNIEGISGTVNLTEITATTISGDFIITAKDGAGTVYDITEGVFKNVPKP